MTSPDFWALLRVLAKGQDSAAPVFEVLEKGTMGTPPAIMADNYDAAVSLLNDFASSAASSALPQPKTSLQQDKREGLSKKGTT